MIPFEERLELIKTAIQKRKHKWTLSTMSYDDVSQIILIRVHNKYGTFDERKGDFTHWLNRVISNIIKNLLRDNLIRFSRPCLTCKLNRGNEFCEYTKSGKQCEECPLFKHWAKKKQYCFNIEQPLSIDLHANETYNVSTDFVDVDGAKKVIDERMRAKLKPFEYRIYHMLYIENRTQEEVGKMLKYKKSKNSKIAGYQALRKMTKKFITMTRVIIKDEGLV